MTLQMLIYRSHVSEVMNRRALRALVEASAERNRQHGISGVLSTEEGFYFQYLEGPADALDRLWANLQRDGRHDQIRQLSRKPVESRLMPDFPMTLDTDNRQSLFQRLSVSGISTHEDRRFTALLMSHFGAIFDQAHSAS